MKKSKKPDPTTIDEYLNELPENVRTTLEKLRRTIKSAAPEAEEVISYKMPGFKYHGMLVYFSAFKNHCSLFPASSLIMKMEEVKSYKSSTGTLQFTIDKPLPTELVKQIVKTRMKQNEERERANELKKVSTKKTVKKKIK